MLPALVASITLLGASSPLLVAAVGEPDGLTSVTGGRPTVYERAAPSARDPNDEAGGRGAAVVPRVVGVTASSPAWMRRTERWGDSRAGWVPGEEDSPRGPAFQSQCRRSDPGGWAARARPCTGRDCTRVGACDGAEWRNAGVGVVAVVVGAGVLWRRRPPSRQ